MITRRDAILSGVTHAAELHATLGLRQRLSDGYQPLDVLSAIQQVGLLVLFKPLSGLLGAYLPAADTAGMIITTKRDLHVQRFTAAHELGHHVMNHQVLSLDKDVGFVARGERTGHSYQELEADSFASEFLLPKWLIMAHVRRHKWSKSDLAQPDNVYQLSLRLGASYLATCWALSSNDVIDKSTASQLVHTQPKTAKQRAIPDFSPDSWHSDIWLLSEDDRGTQVLGSPEDVLVLALEEHVAGGYMWDLGGLTTAGLKVERDERREKTTAGMGAAVKRRLVVQGAGKTRLRLEERRPWDSNSRSLNTFELDLALVGRESEGLPRIARPIPA